MPTGVFEGTDRVINPRSKGALERLCIRGVMESKMLERVELKEQQVYSSALRTLHPSIDKSIESLKAEENCSIVSE